MAGLSRFFATIEGHTSTPPPLDSYREWVKCDGESDEVMVRLVVHRHVRNRGGLGGQRLDLTVFETKPVGTLPDRARQANRTTFTLHPK